MPSSVVSVDDVSSNASSYDSDEEYQLAQQEWEESLDQLRQLVAIVLMPMVGKWLGRRWSHILYSRYLRVGLSKAFFLGESRHR
ncbi:hypothetical protein D9619_002986 [Psilocybe cf. subviscida]|uniref:Uncharacterized protein n=1 Tax=Psilocybe cf. subviscida TaxID=2480587 RepID=A0A8H5AX48_9AGAR|nr:hypothetical protein D9619_002986 [Psilocybe cf. subviscida]